MNIAVCDRIPPFCAEPKKCPNEQMASHSEPTLAEKNIQRPSQPSLNFIQKGKSLKDNYRAQRYNNSTNRSRVWPVYTMYNLSCLTALKLLELKAEFVV